MATGAYFTTVLSMPSINAEQGMAMNEEMMKVFKDKVVGFPTLMEVIK